MSYRSATDEGKNPKKIRSEILEDHCDHFWSCRIFILFLLDIFYFFGFLTELILYSSIQQLLRTILVSYPYLF